ncbi:MAG: 3',5'-cyclic-nucleotide phosphodiesterase [Deltaproteobacteria bacterium]|nr:3',5'-cyclic-nucleotide phosphodiesterase [Deltaproteobacteria bacterium]MBM4297063.1 3',5'-cyclic-nucleotide phosphodiesterase [Deltaproteobacteria bacterium]
MKLRVLGCSGGQLPGHRLSSFLVDDTLLIDAGGVTGALSWQAQLKIQNILVTHIHLDHVMGLGTLADNLFGKCKASINIWGTRPIVEGLRKYFFNDGIWPDFTKIKGPSQTKPVLQLRVLPIKRATRVGNYRITPVAVHHIVPSVAFFIQNQTKTLLHLGDTGPTSEVWSLAKKQNSLGGVVIETSFPNRLRDVAAASRHLTPAMLAREIDKLNRPATPIYVTHLKPQFRREIIAEIKALRRPQLHVLKDDEVLRF